MVTSQAREPHLPCGRLADGSWLFAPLGVLVAVGDGAAVVCHGCGQALAALSAAHLGGHGLTPTTYRERFGLNRKASLLSPALAQRRREEGAARWVGNDRVRVGLAVGQEMARSGALYELGAGAQPQGARRVQGRLAASRSGASPALAADRERRSAAARERWCERARGLGFDSLEAYLAHRVGQGVSLSRLRRDLGCGGAAASRLLAEWLAR
ncbi:hypothetical protein GCM10009845_21980 [Pedococcus bigeumensis]